MKAGPFELHVPRELPEAIELLGQLGDARVLAGGQSLVPMLNLRVASPRHLIDLNRIAELAGIREEEGAVVIGAMTRQRDLEASELVARQLPLFAEAVRHVGHRQTRNRGTVGGSLCHLDPSAELPAACMAMDATLVVQSRRGVREIAMRDFPAGFMTPSLEEGELLTSIVVRPWGGRVGTAFVEYARRHGDFAVVSVCALVELDGRGHTVRSSLTLGGVAEVPVRVSKAQDAIRGRRLDGDAIAQAARECAAVEAMSDAFIPGWYRQQVARTLAERALCKALERVAQ